MSDGFRRLWFVLMICWWALLVFPIIESGIVLPSVLLAIARQLHGN
jgi:hypothetical protein